MSKNGLKLVAVISLALLAAGFTWYGRPDPVKAIDSPSITSDTIATSDDPVKARAAFNEAVKVFFSARCSNCHPAGDTPTQGDESRPHDQGVTRGPDGKGPAGLQCATCHQTENLDGDGLPPGAPNWHMPPENNKMVFQGMTAAKLCQQLKDPARNGGRKSLKESIHHIETDPLVGWAWAPGNGRTTPPLSQKDFLKKLNEWIDAGAACPE